MATTVLVVDDDPVTLKMLIGGLRQQGYQVLTAVDAMQAMMAAHRNSPAAILLDIMLPGGGGRDVLRRLKSNTQTQLIPVIAMSSSPDAKLPEQILAAGADEFLPKPVDLARLREALQRVLGSPST
jgi:CheY-like chemotaxis protein